MSIAAIPTEYKGIRFRSRLEAKWACFFDLLGWKWEYEPIDLAGYIPDFIIRLPSKNLLVEVKPATDDETLDPLSDKIATAGWTGEMLLLGACLFSYEGHASLLYTSNLDSIGLINHLAPVGLCAGCGGFALAHGMEYEDGTRWQCLICDTESRFFFVDAVVERLWAIASNETQWRPQR